MAYDADFGEWVREHFHALGRLEIKRMFGGAGVYAAGVMFALLDDGVVWLKGDEALGDDFVAAGSRQFTYPTKDGRTMSMGYWTLPETALDDPDEAVAWARRSLDVAVKKASGKKPKPVT
ncbi:TfoX/Sxy family protein [Brevundimonas vesicularis]|uniref:TfoX/Sxy family protein n=1 Tax=Brevundimonas vesicularis TaxID=41276 RepID=UPI0030BDFB21